MDNSINEDILKNVSGGHLPRHWNKELQNKAYDAVNRGLTLEEFTREAEEALELMDKDHEFTTEERSYYMNRVELYFNRYARAERKKSFFPL